MHLTLVLVTEEIKVSELVNEVLKTREGKTINKIEKDTQEESNLLSLVSDKSKVSIKLGKQMEFRRNCFTYN